jgi:uncharacterized membrane protein YfcA
MTLEPLLVFELALLGMCTGFLAGLLGIGGGMLMVPFMTFINSLRVALLVCCPAWWAPVAASSAFPS